MIPPKVPEGMQARFEQFKSETNKLQGEIGAAQAKGQYAPKDVTRRIQELQSKYPDLLDFHNKDLQPCKRARNSYNILLGAANLQNEPRLQLPVSDDPAVNRAYVQIKTAENPEEVKKFISNEGHGTPAQEQSGSDQWWMFQFLADIIESVKKSASYYMGLDDSQKDEVQRILREEQGQESKEPPRAPEADKPNTKGWFG